MIRYVGRLFVKGNGKPIEIFDRLSEMAGFARGEEIELFEVNPLPCFESLSFQILSFC